MWTRIVDEAAAVARDARLALRSLLRTPGYTAAVIAILALAIGATTALFTVVNAALLRPLPYRDPSRLTIVKLGNDQLEDLGASYPLFLDWRERSRGFESLVAVRFDAKNLTGLDRPERIQVFTWSAGTLGLLGVQPLLGRDFTPAEDRPGGPGVALVDHGFWRTRLGGDPDVLGRTILLDGQPQQIVGVLPSSFTFAGPRAPVILPVSHMAPELNNRGTGPGLVVLGRLAPGVSLAQGSAEVDALTRAIGEVEPKDRGARARLVTLQDELVRDVRGTLLLLMAAVVLVLLIAVANVANLALARGLARHRELAIRAALGAGRGRLARQMLVESAVLGLAGGAVGVLLALWGVDLVVAARPEAFPRVTPVEVDGGVLAFAAAASLGAGLLFGLVPALALSEARLADALRATPGAGGARGRTRATLVVVEVALAFVLLAGAGLTLRALLALQRTPLGFDPRNLLTFSVTVNTTRYDTGAKVRAYYDALLSRLGAVPGVEVAALSRGLPFGDGGQMGWKRRDDPIPEPKDQRYANYFVVSARALEALGVRTVAGRGLAEADGPGASRVAVVDENLARAAFPDQEPVGRWLSSTFGKYQFQIVGVVPHIRRTDLGMREETPYEFWYPLSQMPDEEALSLGRYVYVVLRTSVPPLSVLPAVEADLAALDRDQPLTDVKTMEARAAESLAPQRFGVALLGGFAALALLLAAVGLYAVMAYTVSRRTHEIGVRMALGAQPGTVQRMVVGQGLRLAMLGLGLGALGAAGAARVASHMVSNVAPLDPLPYAGVALLLALVAGAATWLPARRATRVDPVVALREE